MSAITLVGMCTPNLASAMSFFCIVSQPRGAYEKVYQIVTGPLLEDARVSRFTKRVVYVPAYHWASLQFVLAPIKLTQYGQRTLDDLGKLTPMFPHVKPYVEWDAIRTRHIVRYQQLSDMEQGTISHVTWPDQGAILEALQKIAFDSLDDLVRENDEIRTAMTAREVE